MKRMLCLLLIAATPAAAQINSVWAPTTEFLGYAYGGRVDRTFVPGLTPYSVYTIGALLGAHNEAGVDQWVFGIATEAISQLGSKSIVVGFESAAVNMEPLNFMPKIANNAVFKNRLDGAPTPSAPMNANSIAYWITAQPGTGFERGLVFHDGSLASAAGRPVAIDFSGVGPGADIMKFSDGCVLRYAGGGVLTAVCP